VTPFRRTIGVLALGVVLAGTGCAGGDDAPTEVVLVTHDSFAISPAVKQAFEAESGLMSVTGEPGGQPQKVGVAVTDVFTGVYSATAILAALLQRGITLQFTA